MENLYTQQYSMWSIHPVYCENVTFKNVMVKSGADGIDVDSCKHTVIDGCTFETGDDSISLKSGRGAEGNTIGRPCEDVLITNCTLSDAGFANIGIGSETSAGVRNVRIEHCKFISARSFAIFIKTRTGRGAYIEDISATDLDVSGMRQGFLQISVLGVGKADAESVLRRRWDSDAPELQVHAMCGWRTCRCWWMRSTSIRRSRWTGLCLRT